MRNVWLLTFLIALFGFANGGFQLSTPQACLLLGMDAEVLGWVCTGLPFGYAASCLLYGRLFANTPGKYVLIGGTLWAALSCFAMSTARTNGVAAAAQLSFGLATGAFWPFASAWMLDFQSAGIARERLLRHYNVAWTSGSATGMLVCGWTCRAGWVEQTLFACGIVALVVVGLALLVPKTQPAGTAAAAASPLPQTPVFGWQILAAAVLANILALGLRGVIMNNYAELNELRGYGADRMGLVNALVIAAQLVAFFAGRLYEPHLGLRRVYALIAISLTGVALIFATQTSAPLLYGAAVVHGFALALAFQSGIVAATGYFSRARTGTTFHEAMVGLSTMSPVAAGQVIGAANAHGYAPEAALQAPLVLFAALALFTLLVQVLLVRSWPGRRSLQPH